MALSLEQQRKIFELLEQGKRIKEIAKEVGCSENTVRRYKKEWERLRERGQGGAIEIADKGEGVRHAGTLKALQEGRGTNILDLARDETQVMEIGASAGAVVAGMLDDFASAFDTTKPVNVRFAKAMRGSLTASSLLFAASEFFRNVQRERKRRLVVRVSETTKEELKEKIMDVVLSNKHREMSVDEIVEVVGADENRVMGAIEELIREGRLEVRS
ncbi:hypothetical protein DRN52_08340 [Thermococci archaeon]|nr:MAG: hypothetical protein DRN52_08340 [Thermococci archaeon]